MCEGMIRFACGVLPCKRKTLLENTYKTLTDVMVSGTQGYINGEERSLNVFRLAI
jgi:hypothetical protein